MGLVVFRELYGIIMRFETTSHVVIEYYGREVVPPLNNPKTEIIQSIFLEELV